MARKVGILIAVSAFYGVPAAQAVVMQTVHVGDPDNPMDTRYPDVDVPGVGGVDHAYNIGSFEVTAGQYTEFLNAVAATDAYGLYNPGMWTDNQGCQIARTGSSGSYAYSVADDWAYRPVTYVSWFDAARFANWMHNGQRTGVQDFGTTEDGSYFLNGALTDTEGMAIVREADATWVIPSEDEWYKAAYFDRASGWYYSYPTSSDSVPSNVLLDPDPGNNATYYSSGFTIGAPYYRTEVGAEENSDSPYGTFDQGGNVWEWNETLRFSSYHGLRGGSFTGYGVYMHASYRSYTHSPAYQDKSIGFRVAEVGLPVPIPAVGTWGLVVTTIALLGAATLAFRRATYSPAPCRASPADPPAGRR